jgi:hypothetical protein
MELSRHADNGFTVSLFHSGCGRPARAKQVRTETESSGNGRMAGVRLDESGQQTARDTLCSRGIWFGSRFSTLRPRRLSLSVYSVVDPKLGCRIHES